jgi:hypothetical protein
MNDPEQLPLDFNAPATAGYEMWQWGLAEAERRIAEEWELPLNAQVRVKLWNLDQEFAGRLKLARRPARLHRKEPLELRIASMPFLSTEIETCAVVDGGVQRASSGASSGTSSGRGEASDRRETSPACSNEVA